MTKNRSSEIYLVPEIFLIPPKTRRQVSAYGLTLLSINIVAPKKFLG